MIPALFLRAIPFLLAAAVGFSGAWYIQGLRITAAKQELVTWQQSMGKAVQEARDYEYRINVEAQNAWAKNMDRLRATWRTGWMPALPNGSGAAVPLPPAPGPDDACRDAISSARRLAEACAAVTLQLNMLQDVIEAQKGYQ